MSKGIKYNVYWSDLDEKLYFINAKSTNVPSEFKLRQESLCIKIPSSECELESELESKYSDMANAGDIVEDINGDLLLVESAITYLKDAPQWFVDKYSNAGVPALSVVSRSKTPTYTIRTVEDMYNAITPKNVDRFIADMKEVFMDMSKQKEQGLSGVTWEITWIDDGNPGHVDRISKDKPSSFSEHNEFGLGSECCDECDEDLRETLSEDHVMAGGNIFPKTGMTYEQALLATMEGGLLVKLPEWTGFMYWDEQYMVYTYDCREIRSEHIKHLAYRNDWEITDGLRDFSGILKALDAGKKVKRAAWGSPMHLKKENGVIKLKPPVTGEPVPWEPNHVALNAKDWEVIDED